MGILKAGATLAPGTQMPLSAVDSMTSVKSDDRVMAASAVHVRPTAAETPRPSRLGTRLALSVALSVAAVVSLVAMAGAIVAGQQLDSDLRETARVTAVAVGDEIELRNQTPTRESLLPVLRTFMNAAADLSDISIYEAAATGPTLVLHTSEVANVPESVVRTAIATNTAAWSPPDPYVATVAAPFTKGSRVIGAVAVSVSLRGISQLQRTAGVTAAVGALFSISAITLLIHLRARRLILEPLKAIRHVMLQARGGNLSARAEVRHDDELGEVASGLNAMLAELEDLNRTLTERVSSKTEELRERNAELVRSYESLLQLRETAGRAQELAAVGQTMANVAHQIGTPLNLVSGHVQLLQREVTDAGLQRRLTIVQEQVDRVTTAVRELLQRARPRPNTRRVDLKAMLERIAEATRLRLAAARVTLVSNLPETLPPVTADDTQLELAILNLITNAVDAMTQGGTLTLSALGAGNRVRIDVTDTGSGIPAELLPRIFEPWVTTKSAGKGTGLGLSITRDVVVRLGGTALATNAPGGGAMFTIELPISEDAA
jgi:signal transduction histidine kinase